MDKNSQPEPPITAEELRSYPWQQLIRESKETLCSNYYKAFKVGYEEAEKESDQRGVQLFEHLNIIASYRICYDNVIEPYQPRVIHSIGERSAIPDDLSEGELDAWLEIYSEIEDPEFRARITDILWIQKKNYKAAQCAIGSFLESAKKHRDGVHWFDYLLRLERATVLSSKRGFEEQRKFVVEEIEAAIDDFQTNLDTGFLCHRLMDLLIILDEGDRGKYLNLSKELAKAFTDIKKWRFAEAYWKSCEKWCRLMQDEHGIYHSICQLGECHVSGAEEQLAKDQPDYLSAARWLATGVEALRRGKAAEERIKNVHQQLLDAQARGRFDLKPLDFDPDSISGLKEERARCIEASIANVKGRDFDCAVVRLAFCSRPTDVEELKCTLENSQEGLVAHRLFPSVQMDTSGKISDVMPAKGIGDDEPNHKELVKLASQIYWPTTAEWQLDPARNTIMNEHPVRVRDLEFLVYNNPFIPEGREWIYMRGIQAGFYGDWLQAMHFLIPQLESSLRYVLQQHGVVTSTLDSDQTQKERDINQLLWDEKLEEILGADTLFHLRGILIERFGSNMRNEFAHGLMEVRAFYRAESIYLWWLVIRLCVHGYKCVMNSP